MADAHWQKDPEPHDFPAAGDYLTLAFTPKQTAVLVDALRSAKTGQRKAKDLLRASGLPLLAADDPYVARDLAKATGGKKLSPVLLVRGDGRKNAPLTIADGYHRICASYHLDPDEEVSCRIVDLP